MEYLIGFACLVLFMGLGMVITMLHSFFSGLLESLQQKKGAGAGLEKICTCPRCKNDLYDQVREVIDNRPHVSLVHQIELTCIRCKTVSIWLPLGDPPELKSYRPPGTKRFLPAPKSERNQAAND